MQWSFLAVHVNNKSQISESVRSVRQFALAYKHFVPPYCTAAKQLYRKESKTVILAWIR